MNDVIYSDVFATKLEQNEQIGISLGAGLYKIRLSIESKGGGKSGGFRVITYVVYKMPVSHHVYLLTMYDKSEDDSITKDQLMRMVQKITK
jgi:hypothetical protein